MESLNLDVKDRRILLALDMDARKPESYIARKVRLSKQLTNYRIKRLEKNRIIQSYYPVIDHTKIGNKLYRIALKLENITKDKEEEIIKYLKNHASWITSVLGPWDVWMTLYVKDEYEFMNFWSKFYDKFGFYIKSRWISLITKFWNFERSFIYPEKRDRQKMFILGEKPEINKLDRIDKKVLEELNLNSRQTTLDIATKIKQTERVVRYRIKKLEIQKIILGYRTFLNTNALSLKYYKLFIQLKDIKSGDIERIRTFIRLNPNVIYSTEALGGYDFELETHFHDSQDLMKFILDIKEKFPTNIKDVRHMEYIKEFKIGYYPF